MKKQVMGLLNEYGFGDQTKVVEDLVKNEYSGKSVASTRAYFNQVLHGRSPISYKLRNALIRITNSDSRLSEILESQKKPERSLEESLREMIHDEYRYLLRAFDYRDDREQIELTMDFIQFVKKYKPNV